MKLKQKVSGNTEFFRQTADLKTNFKWREIFSEMFKNHTDEQKEKILVSGCKEFMPSEAKHHLETRYYKVKC